MNERVERRAPGNQAARAPRLARRRAAIAVTAAALPVLVLIAALAAVERWPGERDLLVARGSGWLALATLFAALSLEPLARAAVALVPALPALASVSVLRRALGMSAAWLALLHAALAYQGWLLGNWKPIWTWAHLRAGLVGLWILLALLATSYTRVIALLRLRGWKQLHRLAYVAALLVLQHMLLSPFASRTGTLLLLGAGLLLVALKLLIAVQTRRGRWRPTPET